MNFLIDFLPVILFFLAFKAWDIYVATGVAIAAALVQVVWQRLRKGRVEKIQKIVLVIVVLSGGLTLALHDPMFIKWKPTLVNLLFAAVFAGSHLVGERVMLERILGHAITLPQPVWRRFNIAWAVFFTGVALANVYVVYHYDDATWVNFKVFGVLGLTLAFLVIQGLVMARYAQTDADAKPEAES